MPLRASFKGPRDSDGVPATYLNGIPARDLDEDEWQALTTEERDTVRRSGLYDVKTDAEVHPPKKGGES